MSKLIPAFGLVAVLFHGCDFFWVKSGKGRAIENPQRDRKGRASGMNPLQENAPLSCWLVKEELQSKCNGTDYVDADISCGQGACTPEICCPGPKIIFIHVTFKTMSGQPVDWDKENMTEDVDASLSSSIQEANAYLKELPAAGYKLVRLTDIPEGVNNTDQILQVTVNRLKEDRYPLAVGHLEISGCMCKTYQKKSCQLYWSWFSTGVHPLHIVADIVHALGVLPHINEGRGRFVENGYKDAKPGTLFNGTQWTAEAKKNMTTIAHTCLYPENSQKRSFLEVLHPQRSRTADGTSISIVAAVLVTLGILVVGGLSFIAVRTCKKTPKGWT